MPSPVEVRIGEWKRLRCVVTSVTMKYEGPWRTSSSATLLKSHSPYMYEATFAFTVVSEFNTVQYSEDIIDNGSNGGYASSNTPGSFTPDLTSSALKNQYTNRTNISIGDNNTSIIYSIQQHAGEEGTVVDTSASFANTTAYLQSLGLPTDSNGASKLAGMAEITSGLTAIVETSLIRNYGTNITKVFGK